MAERNPILDLVHKQLSAATFRDEHWEGSFSDYLDLVSRNPRTARNAFQRIYDMVLHFGAERYTSMREDMTRYHFFSDPIGDGADAIFGLEQSLMSLVDFFKCAAQGYGTQNRILLLHGPVGSSKSTIVRLLKKGLQYYSRLDEGALYRPAVNIRLGTLYLERLYRRFKGNAIHTAASYNAGPTAVRRWLRTMKSLPPGEFVERIPYGETQRYVKKVLATAALYRRLYSGQ